MKLKYYVILARPQHNLAAALVAAASYLVASDGYLGYSILVPIIVAILLDAGGMASNDFFDTEIDKGIKDRPIVSGLIQRDSAIIFAGSLFLIAMLIAALSRNLILILAACMLSIMGSNYNVKMKRYGLLGNINVGMTVCWYTVLGWSGYTDQILDLRLLFLFFTLIFVR